VLRRDRVSTDRSAIRDYFLDVGPANEITAVMEACYGWEYFHDEALRTLLSDKFGKRGRERMRKLMLRGNDTETLIHYLDLLGELEARQRAVEKQIRSSV